VPRTRVGDVAANLEETIRLAARGNKLHAALMVFPELANASTSQEIDSAFTTLVRERPDALFVGGDPFFSSRRMQLTGSSALT
jgi:predicted amidohydrolase